MAQCSVCNVEANIHIQPPRFWALRVETMWLERNIQVIEVRTICDECVVEIVKLIVAVKEGKMVA